jgi:hypothetical protein
LLQAPREFPPEVDLALGGYIGRYQNLRGNTWKKDLAKSPAKAEEES